MSVREAACTFGVVYLRRLVHLDGGTEAAP